MAADLDVFKTVFAGEYQDDFYKRAVGRVVANFRFQKDLKWGVSVDRKILDMSGITVRDITPNADRTIAALGDSKETLTIDKIKGADFRLSDHDLLKDGPLNAGRKAGKDAAEKLSLYVDGDILYEITSLTYDFDNGDLTTLSSTGTPITLSSTTVPQMVARMPAKNNFANKMSNEDTVLIIDSYAASDIGQYVMGKNIDLAGTTFKNGYAGTVGSSEVIISEKLTAQALLTFTGQPSNGETLVINGITFTAVTVIGSTAGNFLIGANTDASLTNLAGLMNAPSTTSATQVALTGSSLTTWQDMRVTATGNTTADTVSIVCVGSGRLAITEGMTNVALTSNYLHCYYGKRGFTDVVMQEEVDLDDREEPKQRTTNFLFDRTYGIKTFADGKVRGLDVLIAA